MPTSVYTTAELLGLVRENRPLQPYFTRNYFGRVQTSDKQQVAFDKMTDTRRLAPFVMPKVEGKPMRKLGSATEFFAPAYIKDKCVICPTDAIPRMPGEDFFGTMSLQQRMAAHTRNAQVGALQRLDNRVEVMAAELLRTGKVTCVGDDYPEVEVDFGRAPDLDIDLQLAPAGYGATWDLPASEPLNDIETMSETMSDKPFGGPASDLYLGSTAWRHLRKHQDVLDQMDLDRSLLTRTSIDTGPLAEVEQVMYVGTIAGRFNLYVDTRSFELDDGTVVRILPRNEVVFVSRGAIQGWQLYGAIMDIESLVETRFFPKMWIKEDPSAFIYLAQSAPMVASVNQNGCARMIVSA